MQKNKNSTVKPLTIKDNIINIGKKDDLYGIKENCCSSIINELNLILRGQYSNSYSISNAIITIYHIESGILLGKLKKFDINCIFFI